MSCIIGMTTDIEQRKADWKGKHPNLEEWKILAGPFSSKAQAQTKETELAREHRCKSHMGGADPDDPNAKWYIYRFNY